MKSFLEFITEDAVQIQQANLGIARENMPQIAQADLDEFLDWLQSQGHTYSVVKLPAGDLSPTQHELNQEKIDSYADKDTAFYKKMADIPVMAAQDHRLADGHHRWGGILKYSPSTPMTVVRVDMNIADLLGMMGRFEKSFSRSV
jgi:hypothetical protein